MPKDKSWWTFKYLGNCTGGTFIQDFTCTWFPKHGKGEEKKLWPQKPGWPLENAPPVAG